MLDSQDTVVFDKPINATSLQMEEIQIIVGSLTGRLYHASVSYFVIT